MDFYVKIKRRIWNNIQHTLPILRNHLLRGAILENICSKCKTVMVNANLDSFPIRIYKTGKKPNANTMSNISPCYVCPCCGFIEFYVEEPEKFR